MQKGPQIMGGGLLGRGRLIYGGIFYWDSPLRVKGYPNPYMTDPGQK
jgi:hypothetical protein